MNALLFVALLVSSPELFSGEPIWSDPTAFVRSPESSIKIKTERYKGVRIGYIEASLGRTVPVLTFNISSWKAQLALQGSGWIVLGKQGDFFPLITEDWYFAFPVFVKKNNLSFGVKWNHISSHRGDGMDVLLEKGLSSRAKADFEDKKEMADKYGVGITLSPTYSYSRDFISGHVIYSNSPWEAYVQGGYIYRIIPERLQNFFTGTGFQFKSRHEFPLYVASDFTYNGDMKSLDVSSQSGVYLSSKPYEFRVVLSAYKGSDRRGQFLGRKITQFGIGISLR